MSKFVNWCKKQKLIDETKLEFYLVDEQSEQYGLRALSDLNENDPLLAIPRKCMLTSDDALRDHVFGEFRRHKTALSKVREDELKFEPAQTRKRTREPYGFRGSA